MGFSEMSIGLKILSILMFVGVLAVISLLVYILILSIRNYTFIPVAFRNLIRERKRSALLVGAIAFGILIITIVNCASTGAVNAISENITKIADGHIFIQGQKKLESGKVVNELKHKDEILKVIEDSGVNVVKINKRSELEVELIFGDNVYNTQISGMNWEAENDVKSGLGFKDGALDVTKRDGIVINEKLAEDLDVVVGDTIIAKLRTVTGQTNVGDFTVTGILQGTDILSSLTSYANIDYINELLGISANDYLTIYIRLESLDVVDGIADKLYADLDNLYQMKERSDTSDIDIFSLAFSNKEKEWEGQRYNLRTVTEMVGIMDQFVGVVNGITIGVLVLLFIIIIVGVVNTFRMIMYDRVKEIGSMRAMGMHKDSVKSLFIYEGFLLAVAGSIIGVAVSGIIMFIASLINLGTDHAGSFFLSNGHLVFSPEVGVILLNSIAVSVITSLAVYFPAKKAANLDPAKAIASMY